MGGKDWRWHLRRFRENHDVLMWPWSFFDTFMHRWVVEEIRIWDVQFGLFWLNQSIKKEFSWLFGYSSGCFWPKKKNEVSVVTTCSPKAALVVLEVRKRPSLRLNEKRQVVSSCSKRHVVHCWEIDRLFNVRLDDKSQFNAYIRIVRFDKGDYLSSSFSTFFCRDGIIHRTIYVDTPRQNGVVGWKNCHLLEVTRSLMIDIHVPKSYWGNALFTVAYLISKMPSLS